MPSTLLLLRHLPGAGSTTLARSLGGVVFAADDYFYQPSHDGWQYQFNPAELKAAHAQCLRNTEIAIKWELPLVIVTNTFTQQWELQPYFDLAKHYGILCHSLIVENRHGGSNEHGVPEAIVAKMAQRFEVQLQGDRVCQRCQVKELRSDNSTGLCARCQRNSQANSKYRGK